MKKPAILVTSRNHDTNQPTLLVNKNYIDALNKCGAICFMYTYGNLEDVNEIAQQFDGLLVTGGQDIDPKYYNEPLDPTDYLAADYIDETDLALIHAFHKANKPILGICRGMQVLNVAFGGSLYQDLNTSGLNIEQDYHNQKHRNLQHHDGGHRVIFEEGTLLYDMFGSGLSVNTYHHQATKSIGDGLTVCGRSDDGVVEAFTGNKIIGVQWHPEWMVASQPLQIKIFEEFLKQAKQ